MESEKEGIVCHCISMEGNLTMIELYRKPLGAIGNYRATYHARKSMEPLKG